MPPSTPNILWQARARAAGRCARSGWRKATASAILENRELLAVIPGWSDISTGMPGYCATSSARPRSAGRSMTRWKAWAASGAGNQVLALAGDEQVVAAFPAGRARPPARQAWPRRPVLGRGRWQAAAGRSLRAPADGYRHLHRAVHGGQCTQRMPAVERLVDDVGARARIELAIATTLPSTDAARIFLWLAQYPWRDVDLARARPQPPLVSPARHLPAGRRQRGRAAAGRAGRAAGPGGTRASGFTFGGDPVRWLWVIPISERERLTARERGAARLITQLAAQGRSWVVS